MTIAYVLIGILVVLVLAYILINNSLIGARNKCDEAWSGIDVQLKRRHDLVPNLVETVKGYAAHEQASASSSSTRPIPSNTAAHPGSLQKSRALTIIAPEVGQPAGRIARSLAFAA